MPHLVTDVGQRRASLGQEAPKRMAKVLKADVSEACPHEQRLKYPLAEVVHFYRRTRLRGEHEFVRDIGLVFPRGIDEPLIAKIEQDAPEFPAHIHPPRLLAFGCNHCSREIEARLALGDASLIELVGS